MQAKQLLFSSLLSAIFFCVPASAQQPTAAGPFGYPAGRLESVKLLSPGIGWAATRKHLFWTTNDGKDWKDITPKPPTSAEAISAVFFLDSSTGWVLLAGGGNDDQPRFDLASTTDTGMHWTVTHVKTSALNPPEATLTGGGYMYFLDSAHGWVNLSVASGSAFHPGAALTTEDGGRTWNWVPMGAGTAGPILFTTLKDGWILSPDHTELYATHDGSKAWNQISLHAPPLAHAGSGEAYSYELPTFDDAGHGFLMAGFADSNRMTLFTTSDGGLTWKADRVLPHVEESTIAISHSRWMAVSIPLHSGTLTVTTLPLGNAEGQATAIKADVSNITGKHALGGASDRLDMVDDAHGWLLAGELLSTSDGGATWTDVTPPGARPAVRAAEPGPQSALPPRTAEGQTHLVGLGRKANPAAYGSIQTSMGFDSGYVHGALWTPQ